MYYWHSEEVSLLGTVTVVMSDTGVCRLSLQSADPVLELWQRRHPREALLADPAATVDVFRQLNEYASGQRKGFDLPLSPAGTPFQQSVWSALQEIPYGELRSYREIAQAIGNPAAVRAVGMANRNNPICVVIPCHRVIGSNGSLVGYAFGLPVKERLLALEAANYRQDGCPAFRQAI